LRFAPCLPADWQSFKINYRYRETFYRINFANSGSGRIVKRVALDGVDQPQKTLPLIDDRKQHVVEVEIE
ncbi:MAG: hypothetical protein ABSB33_12390, partial [Tepidisphaeraceae bacterium]